MSFPIRIPHRSGAQQTTAPPADARRRVAWLATAGPSLALALLAALVHLPFRATALYAWDSVLYARAIASFNVAEGRPHPPGYLFYVASAALANRFLGDPNASVVLVSQVAGAVAVGLTYLVGRRLVGAGPALEGAARVGPPPPVWRYSGVAYPYTVLATLSLLLALLLLGAPARGPRGLALLGLAGGLAGGFRLDLLGFLAPLAIWQVTKPEARAAEPGRPASSRRPGRLLPFGAGVAVGTLGWLLPTAALSGGLARYVDVLARQFGYVAGAYSLVGHGTAALAANGTYVAKHLAEALGPALAPLIAALVLGMGHAVARMAAARRGESEPRAAAPPALFPAAFFVLWVGPALLFYLAVHIGDRGYLFGVLPSLALLAGVGVWRTAEAVGRLAGRARRLAAPALALALAGLLLAWNGLQFLDGRSRVSAYELRCFSAAMAASVEEVRTRFRPEETLVFGSFYYQHARELLPEYRAWHFDPSIGPTFRRALPADVRYVVVFGEDLAANPAPSRGELPLPCDRRLYYYAISGSGAQLAYQHNRPSLEILAGS